MDILKNLVPDLLDHRTRICFGQDVQGKEADEKERTPILNDLLLREGMSGAGQCVFAYGEQTLEELLSEFEKNGDKVVQHEAGWRNKFTPVANIFPSLKIGSIPFNRLRVSDVAWGISNDPLRAPGLHSYISSWRKMLELGGAKITDELFMELTIAGLLKFSAVQKVSPPVWVLEGIVNGERKVYGTCTSRPFEDGIETEPVYIIGRKNPVLGGKQRDLLLGNATGAGALGTRGANYFQSFLLNSEKQTLHAIMRTELYIRQKTIDSGGKPLADESMIEICAEDFITSAGPAKDRTKDIFGRWNERTDKVSGIYLAFEINTAKGVPAGIKLMPRVIPSAQVLINGSWQSALDF